VVVVNGYKKRKEPLEKNHLTESDNSSLRFHVARDSGHKGSRVGVGVAAREKIREPRGRKPKGKKKDGWGFSSEAGRVSQRIWLKRRDRGRKELSAAKKRRSHSGF